MNTVDIYSTHKVIHYDNKEDMLRLIKNLTAIDSNTQFGLNILGETYQLYEDEGILYVPKGVDNKYITGILRGRIREEDFILQPSIKWRYINTGYVQIPLKDDIQYSAVEFFTGAKRYINASSFQQRVLVLPTGTGKTIIAVYAALLLKRRFIIIAPTDTIRNEWMKTLRDIFKLSEDKICTVRGSDDIYHYTMHSADFAVYLVLSQTLEASIRMHDRKILNKFYSKQGIGLKIVDEVHLHFFANMRIDLFSNVDCNFYITATLDRAKREEKQLMKRCFNSAIYYEAPKDDDGKSIAEPIKHTEYTRVLYSSNTHPYVVDQMSHPKFGFSVIAYNDYVFFKEKKQLLLNLVLQTVKQYHGIGKMLILTSTIKAVELIHANLITLYPDKNIVMLCSVNKVGRDMKFITHTADIIVSTSKSCGTGVDIPQLRTLINTEVNGNAVYANQTKGRLRYLGDNIPTYMIEFVDSSFSAVVALSEKKKPILEKLCKSYITKNLSLETSFI
jgi:hypothetical protein